jgi:hypothetical protein
LLLKHNDTIVTFAPTHFRLQNQKIEKKSGDVSISNFQP